MVVENLFKILDNWTNKEVNHLFEESGMINKSKELSYGFFPLGTGILSKQSKENADFKIMVLGNDFSGKTYLNECIINNDRKEPESNNTITNIQELDLNLSDTFFTNLHLGIRDTNNSTDRKKDGEGKIVNLKKGYKEFCFKFFVEQLRLINPEVVLCLGHDVRKSLIEYSDIFLQWKPKSASFKTLYNSIDNRFVINSNDKKLGNRKFITIPHPCDKRNFKGFHIEKIKRAMEDYL